MSAGRGAFREEGAPARAAWSTSFALVLACPCAYRSLHDEVKGSGSRRRPRGGAWGAGTSESRERGPVSGATPASAPQRKQGGECGRRTRIRAQSQWHGARSFHDRRGGGRSHEPGHHAEHLDDDHLGPGHLPHRQPALGEHHLAGPRGFRLPAGVGHLSGSMPRSGGEYIYNSRRSTRSSASPRASATPL